MVLEQPSSRGENSSIMLLVTDLLRPVVAVAVVQSSCTAQRLQMHPSMQIVQVMTALIQCCVQTAWTWSTSLLPSRLRSLVCFDRPEQHAAKRELHSVRPVELPGKFGRAGVQPVLDHCVGFGSLKRYISMPCM